MRRLLAALVAVLFLITPTQAHAPTPGGAADFGLTGTPQRYFLNLNSVGMITCLSLPDTYVPGAPLSSMTMLERMQVRMVTGTGAVVAPGMVLTAAHVVDGFQVCEFKGELLTPLLIDSRLDYAVLTAALPDTPAMPVACGGLVRGQEYLGIGWAGGRDFAVQRLRFSGVYADMPVKNAAVPAHHQAIMAGEAYGGMSGGPVVDGAGRVRGVINVGGPGRAGVRDLSETPLCAAPAQGG